MTKPIIRREFPAEYGALVRKVETHERADVQSRYLPEIDTTGLSNEAIDTIIVGGGRGAPENGILISDPKNKLLLIRQEGVYRKVKVE